MVPLYCQYLGGYSQNFISQILEIFVTLNGFKSQLNIKKIFYYFYSRQQQTLLIFDLNNT